MKKYELMLVLPGTLDEKEAETRSNEVVSMFKDVDGTSILQAMGKVRLAYPIKHIRYGYFYTLVFSAEPSAVKALSDKLHLMRDILRGIITDFNEQFAVGQKMNYITNGNMAVNPPINEEMGRGRIEKVEKKEEKTEVVEVEAVKEEKKVEKKVEEKISMQDINKKLDEILSGDIIPGI
ncbi:MAG: 30S ribosomal protein S6 [bacterium]|nr:30S ribosomal protein S6 [bacterium]